MSKYITKKQYDTLLRIPRDRMATRAKIFCGTILERDGKILLVQEEGKKYPGYDLPGGKMLWGEKIIDCAVRECTEESGFLVDLVGLVGIYQRINVDDETDYFRYIFVGKIDRTKRKCITDESVISRKWVSIKDILEKKVKVRSSEVYKEIMDYAVRTPIDIGFIGEYVW